MIWNGPGKVDYCRRLSNDYELKVQTSGVFIDLAAIHLMLKRLAPRNTL